MPTPEQILVDLLTSDSTSEALRDRLRIPVLTIEAMLKRHEIDGLVTSSKLADCLTVYRLSDNGREVARSLTPAAVSHA